MALVTTSTGRCEGTDAPLFLAVGVMSRPANVGQRMAVRVTWGRATPDLILPCFLIGEQVKRTPRAPWDITTLPCSISIDLGGIEATIGSPPEDMNMQVKHGLPAEIPNVGHQSITALIQTLIARDLGCDKH